jgi:uncharacterized membrane protein
MKTTAITPHKSSFGLDANILSVLIFIVMAALSWVTYLAWVAWIVPLVVIIMEKESGFVKFQASTALVVGVILVAIIILFRIIIWIMTPRDLYAVANFALGKGYEVMKFLIMLVRIIRAVFMVLILYLAFMAYSYKQVELPIIGSIANKAGAKLNNVNVNQQSDNNQQESPNAKKKDHVFCGECGAKNAAGTKFCGSCGKALV